MGRKKFTCFHCGCCCRSASDLPDMENYLDRHGNCRYFNPDTNECQIYDSRPVLCNVKEYYEQNLKGSIDWDDYIYTTMLTCVMYRWLYEIPEPADSPFLGMQDEIAVKVASDYLDAATKHAQEQGIIPVDKIEQRLEETERTYTTKKKGEREKYQRPQRD